MSRGAGPPRAERRRGLALLALVPLIVALQVVPQEYGGWSRRSDHLREGFPRAGNGVVDRGFTFCRLSYRSVRREANGQGWRTDFPGSDHNFVFRLPELTTAEPSRWPDGQPGFAIVSATDAELYQCPFLFMSDVGTVGFTYEEVKRLRDYLLKGGMIYADDFWGEGAWEQWASEIARVLPEYPIVDVGPDHMVMHTLYQIAKIPQVPSIQFWRRSGRSETSERGAHSAMPHLRGIFDENGRPLVIMTHNTDIADGWEREGEDEEFFYLFSPESYALGINIAIYSMTH
jgi:hypothetical protein